MWLPGCPMVRTSVGDEKETPGAWIGLAPPVLLTQDRECFGNCPGSPPFVASLDLVEFVDAVTQQDYVLDCFRNDGLNPFWRAQHPDAPVRGVLKLSEIPPNRLGAFVPERMREA